jgi:hypothetical protein
MQLLYVRCFNLYPVITLDIVKILYATILHAEEVVKGFLRGFFVLNMHAWSYAAQVIPFAVLLPLSREQDCGLVR